MTNATTTHKAQIGDDSVARAVMHILSLARGAEVLESKLMASFKHDPEEQVDAMIDELLDAGWIRATVCASTRKPALYVTALGMAESGF